MFFSQLFLCTNFENTNSVCVRMPPSSPERMVSCCSRENSPTQDTQNSKCPYYIYAYTSLTLFGWFGTVFGDSNDDDLDLDDDQGDNMKDVCPDVFTNYIL